MTETRTNRIKALLSGLALLTNQEARLLTLIMGLLLLGLSVRFVHLRSERIHPLPPGKATLERTSP